MKTLAAILVMAGFLCSLATCPLDAGAADLGVYSADDEYIGILLDPDVHLGWSSFLVYIPSLGAMARFDQIFTDTVAEPNGYTHTSCSRGVRGFDCYSLYFEDENGTGKAYFSSSEAAVPGGLSINKFGPLCSASGIEGYFILRASGERIFPRCVRSHTSGFEPVTLPEGTTMWAYPLVPVALPFTNPVRLPLKIKVGDVNHDGMTGLEEAIKALQVTAGVQ